MQPKFYPKIRILFFYVQIKNIYQIIVQRNQLKWWYKRKGISFLLTITSSFKSLKIFFALVDTRSSQSLAGVHTVVNLVKTIIKIEIIWDTQAGIFTPNTKLEVTGIKLPHFIQSREVTETFYLSYKPGDTRYDLILRIYFRKLL